MTKVNATSNSTSYIKLKRKIRMIITTPYVSENVRLNMIWELVRE